MKLRHSPLLRPARRLYRRLLGRQDPAVASDRWMMDMRGYHRGERAVIVGNGPSLAAGDLDRLRGEICFASNKIHLAFGETEWRPSYWSCTDVLVARNNREILSATRIPGCVKVFGDSVMGEFVTCDDIIWIREIPTEVPHFSRDLRMGGFGGYSVIYYQLQLAYHLGIREIYLIGVDFSFDVPKPSGETCIHGEVIISEGERNHFHKDYRKPGETWTMPRLDMQRAAFVCADRAFRDVGGRVLNASRRTKLDVFETDDFDSAFPAPDAATPPAERATRRLSGNPRNP